MRRTEIDPRSREDRRAVDGTASGPKWRLKVGQD